jgi:hypothetical protein
MMIRRRVKAADQPKYVGFFMKRGLLTLVLVTLAGPSAHAAEPNETFQTATVLGSGVLSVADELGPIWPDTVLGLRGLFGDVYFVDDDGSYLGDGTASGVCIECDNASVAPTNEGTIDFVVSGYPDENFDGSHSESGRYEVFVDVYDFFGDPVDSFSEVRYLQPGITHDFYYENFEWIDGSYEVYIDNTVGGFDVDFFTFTGLTAGTSFTATTSDPNETNLDTYLGWFDSTGALVADNDDIDLPGGNYLSSLSGVVPANGMLTLAVAGTGDFGFIGDHDVAGGYELQVEVDAELAGDYNSDGTVDAADYVVFRKGQAPGTYATWRENYGESGGGGNNSAETAVPEPTSAWLILAGTFAILIYCSDARKRTTTGGR